ncbi:PREDICTED: probable serine/threonine-protein kinase abkC isoform X1 [Camelina sativa]|uniref:Probable serine/threonine-protein kinase abkC isoform X1 n=1 Tax=Camelina sativa TaxID=90675 RepID=A0ABM0VMR3_CAMSA|nr:PREDICTED: probable serine/threonine-protein kinase abkC isoform X1 [Camelina sativa]
MSRYLISRIVGKQTQSLISNKKDIGTQWGSYRTAFTAALRSPQFRVHSSSSPRIPSNGHCTFSLRDLKGSLLSNHLSRSYFGTASATNVVSHHAQVAWRRLHYKYSARISTIAQAFCLSLTRSHLLIPGIVAVTCGQVAWAQRAPGSALDYYASDKSLYTRAKNGPIFLSSLLFSVIEAFILIGRAFYIACLFTPTVLMGLVVESCGPRFRKVWLQMVHRTLERAGPAFIKWGQWAATRPDLFPKDLCSQLSKLHSNAPEHSFAYTKKTIEKAFGRKLSEIFEEFDEAPVASGSIAQVHRASLRFQYPGQKSKSSLVAVKVRHPGVGESIRRDFVIINLVAKISTIIPALKWLRLDESVQQFGVFMLSQVDLAREASHLSRFIYNFRRWKDVSFPKPVYPLVHPAVLVETYEHGESVARYVDGMDGHEWIKTRLAHIGTHALLKMLLVDNFIHADMHPGNILVRKKASRGGLFKTKKPHIVFLDVGMTAELSKNDRENLLDFFKAVARRDGRTAAERTLKLSRKQNCPNPEAFIEEVEEAFKFWGTPEGDLVHPADCMHELLEKVRRHRVNIDGNVCTVMVTTLVLEGWQRKLDPGYDVMHTLQTMVLKTDWAKSLSYTVDGLMAP